MKRIRRGITLLLAGALLAGGAIAQDKAGAGKAASTPAGPAEKPPASIDTIKRIRDTGTLLLGVRDTSVPFSFVDAQKQPQGYSVDLCLRVADAIKAELKLPKLEVRFVPVTSANRITALLEGKIDLECGSTTNTRDRQKQVAFAYTTYIAGIKMLAKKSSNINSLEDVRGKSVVVTKGTTSEKMLKTMNDERVLKVKIIESPDHGESFKAVDDGKAVAFLMDDVLLYGLISKAKKPDDFAVVGKYLSVEPYAIVMRKDEPAFEKIVNRALIDLFQSGEIRRIYAKWFNTKDLVVPLNPYLKEAFTAPNTFPAWP
ncbi:MAG: amino acid ABC transporter substrate-binding protein [Burkholderiales bacterium]|nr:amino acid ABC transporter substrate-binding protein [Burkholderiales bacterium]